MVAQISSWIGLCGTIAVGFLWVDTKLRPQYRSVLSRWLRGETAAAENWAAVVVALFDRVFKTRGPVRVFGLRLRLPNFWRALASSLLAVTLLGSLWYVLLPPSAVLSLAGYTGFDLWGLELRVPTVIGYDSTELVDGEEVTFLGKQPLHVLIFYPLVSNILLDYVSLVETRFIIAAMKNNVARYRSYVAIDAVLTGLAVVVVGYLSIAVGSIAFGLNFGYDTLRYYFLENYLFEDFFYSPLIYFRLLPAEYVEHQITYARQLSGVYGIFVYSTFLTSLWIWMFLLGSLSIRLIRLVPQLLTGVNRVFDLDGYIDNKPLALIGWVLIIVATVVLAAFRLAL